MMKEDQQQQQQELTKKTSLSEEEIQPRPSRWKRLIRRKWFFPAIYLASAALILALILWYQSPNDFALDPEQLDLGGISVEQGEEFDPAYGFEHTSGEEDAVPVTGEGETESMIWPYTEGANIQPILGYFDDGASNEEQMAALIEYDRSFHPHQGVDFAQVDGQAFDVLAALSGTVIAADKEPLIGNYVEIEHENGLVTVYQSLDEIKVAVGDQVKQGDTIGVAGRNVFEQSLGVHLHFEVRQDGVAVNPEEFLITGTVE